MAIRCLIVDDHTLFREGLRRLLESLGMQRRAKDITPDLKSYVAARGQSAA